MIVTFKSRKEPTAKPAHSEGPDAHIEPVHPPQRRSKRTKEGCLTCKIRKKKCDEARPKCGGCERLAKDCVWIDYARMLEEEIRNLRTVTREVESKHKIRKRKPKVKSEETLDEPLAKRARPERMSEPPMTDAMAALAMGMLMTGVPALDAHPPPLPELLSQTLEMASEPLPEPIAEQLSLLPFHMTTPPPMDDLFDEVKLPLAFLAFLKDLSQMGEAQAEETTETAVVSLPSFTSLLECFSYDPLTAVGHRDYGELIHQVNHILTPLSTSEPSYLPELSLGPANYLYNYYVELLSKQVSVLPTSQNDSNLYQKVFLPLAHKNQGVLYAILGWAGLHLGGEWLKEGARYTEMALTHLNKLLFSNPAQLAGMDRDGLLVKLATLLILCGSEICRGDVRNWGTFLQWGWRLLAANGGIMRFNKSKEEHWLISNFAYHDLLLLLLNERGTYFTLGEYDEIFRDNEGWLRGSLNPLLGVAKRLIRIIGDISTLVFNLKRGLSNYYLRDQAPFVVSPDDDVSDANSDSSEHGLILRLLVLVLDKAKAVEQEIDLCQPDPRDLEGLTAEETELQLTMFEAFQIAAKLFLKQLIMKCNPLMVECQILNNDLIKCLDILVGTLVQSSLVFPAFMAGVHSVTPHDRDLMRRRMDHFSKCYGMWNVTRAKYLMEKVWQQNVTGNNAVDWHAILNELGWDINFG